MTSSPGGGTGGSGGTGGFGAAGPRRAAAADPSPGPDAPASRIGRYRLTRKLGSGSFATVWQGHDDDLDVPVAVKVLADNWSDNADVRNRFLTEARIMRRIRDPRIVRVYDIGTLDDAHGHGAGQPYFVMDYADGGSLESLRKRGLPPTQALRLCAEAARALHVLHTNDIVHRDVTPGNILLNRTSDGQPQVLIADLGVAKSLVGESGATMTAGTPAYMAYEQAIGASFDHRADIYSLTAVTHALLTGRPPFPVRTLADVIGRNVHAGPAPIAAQVGAPAALDALMASGLSAQPERRPQSALVLADALDRIARDMEAAGMHRPWQPAAGTPTPHSFPTPGSFVQTGSLPHGGPTNTVPPHTVPPQTVPPHTVPPHTVPPHRAAGHSLAPQPPTPSAEGEDDDDRHPLFYVFVGIAALALFFVSLLITVVVLN